MLIIIIVLFAIAASLGIYLLSHVLRDKHTPKSIALIHGAVAATALVILFSYVFLYDSSLLASAILFALAAIGGITFLYCHMTGKFIPKWLAIGHGMTAVVAFILLLFLAFWGMHSV